jgi:hypothetical protein
MVPGGWATFRMDERAKRHDASLISNASQMVRKSSTSFFRRFHVITRGVRRIDKCQCIEHVLDQN